MVYRLVGGAYQTRKRSEALPTLDVADGPMDSWMATLTGGAQTVGASASSSTLQTGGSMSYADVTQVVEDDGQTVSTTHSCSTSLVFSSIEIIPHDAGGNVSRGVVVHRVFISNSTTTCGIENGPVDDNRDWWVVCAEGESGASASGLDALAAALGGATPAP